MSPSFPVHSIPTFVISVRVPASTSNLGAGFDCLGLALDLWLEAKLVAGPGDPVYRGTIANLDRERDIVWGIMRECIPDDHHLELVSAIPVSRGLGSSAAAIVAGLALEALVEGRTVAPDEIFRRGTDWEGHPDNVAPAVYGGLVLATPRPTRLAIHASLGIALAVPRATIDTERARALLPKRVDRQLAVEQASRAAALVQGLVAADPDLLALGMEDRLAVPVRKTLIQGYDDAVHAGRTAGAFGVTISGSGSTLLAIGARHGIDRIASAVSEALTRAGNPADPLAPSVTAQGLSITRSR